VIHFSTTEDFFIHQQMNLYSTGKRLIQSESNRPKEKILARLFQDSFQILGIIDEIVAQYFFSASFKNKI